MKFSIIASTGRTATTYIAAALNQLDGVAATHEGYLGSEKDAAPLLPLVNLENAAAYASPKLARESVAHLRNADIVSTAMGLCSANHLIDVAYYNAMIGPEILAQHPQSQMIGIIRDCEGFVRSATAMVGEDPLPVGWPAPNKPLTEREKFIAMGRIRPPRNSPDKAHWANWDAIQRNVWLWRETNLRLCAAKDRYGSRVALLRFSTLQNEPAAFWSFCNVFFDLPSAANRVREPAEKMINKKPTGYQIGASETWCPEAQSALIHAQALIERSANYAL